MNMQSRKCQPEETHEEEVVATSTAKLMKEITPSHDDEIPKERDMLDTQEPPQMNISHKRNPSWLYDIIQEA